MWETVREVSKRLKVSEYTIRNWCLEDKIPKHLRMKAGKNWRIKGELLEQFLQRKGD